MLSKNQKNRAEHLSLRFGANAFLCMSFDWLNWAAFPMRQLTDVVIDISKMSPFFPSLYARHIFYTVYVPNRYYLYKIYYSMRQFKRKLETWNLTQTKSSTTIGHNAIGSFSPNWVGVKFQDRIQIRLAMCDSMIVMCNQMHKYDD